jgi:hypothetical protein
MKATLTFAVQLIHIFFIGLPLAIVLYGTAHLFFELKRIILWMKD